MKDGQGWLARSRGVASARTSLRGSSDTNGSRLSLQVLQKRGEGHPRYWRDGALQVSSDARPQVDPPGRRDPCYETALVYGEIPLGERVSIREVLLNKFCCLSMPQIGRPTKPSDGRLSINANATLPVPQSDS